MNSENLSISALLGLGFWDYAIMPSILHSVEAKILKKTNIFLVFQVITINHLYCISKKLLVYKWVYVVMAILGCKCDLICK